uniref:Uncharacterized protein n=1 Tax=Physcomitrium patens TaxID=3218 RepID=A0A7I3ZIN3_PHYPA
MLSHPESSGVRDPVSEDSNPSSKAATTFAWFRRLVESWFLFQVYWLLNAKSRRGKENSIQCLVDSRLRDALL